MLCGARIAMYVSISSGLYRQHTEMDATHLFTQIHQLCSAPVCTGWFLWCLPRWAMTCPGSQPSQVSVPEWMWKDRTVSPIFTSSPWVRGQGSHLALGWWEGKQYCYYFTFQPRCVCVSECVSDPPVGFGCHWGQFRSGFPGPLACSTVGPGQSTPLHGAGI